MSGFIPQGAGHVTQEPVIEEGVIGRVNADAGVCEVTTISGRKLPKVRFTSPGSPAGFRATPQSNTHCLVVYFLPDPFNHAYLLTTYFPFDEKGNAGSWGAPGDFNLPLKRGGSVLITQSGLMDFKANPWTRLTLIPAERMVRMFMQNLDAHFNPLSHLRLIQDPDAKAAFLEFMLNSRGLYRSGDDYPDVILTLGTTAGSEKASPYNPDSKQLLHLILENRSKESGKVKLHRYRLGLGGEEGVVREEIFEAFKTNVLIRKKTGHFSGTIDEMAYRQNGQDVYSWMLKDDGSLLEKNKEYTFTLDADGGFHIENPAWKIDVEETTHLKIVSADGKMSVTLEDDKLVAENNSGTGVEFSGDKLLARTKKTHLHITGDKIEVGKGKLEPQVLGDTLEAILNELIEAIKAIVLPTPVGPTTGPPLNVAQFVSVANKLKTFKSQLNTVSP